MQKRRKLGIALLLLVALPLQAWAGDTYLNHQLHFRSALLSTKVYGSGLSNTFSVANTIDLEYELFNHSKASTAFRATIAHDLNLGRTIYAFMGVGRRFYFGSTGIVAQVSGNGFEVSHIPKRRYYYGADLGYSSGIISILKNTPLQTVTSMIDLGVVLGFLYQVSKTFAVDAQVGYSFGYGFSGSAAAAQTQRALIGIAHSF